MSANKTVLELIEEVHENTEWECHIDRNIINCDNTWNNNREQFQTRTSFEIWVEDLTDGI